MTKLLNETRPTEITKDDHAKRLIEILELNGTCNKCPYLFFITCSEVEAGCNMCRTFIGLSTLQELRSGLSRCPCHVLKPNETFKLSWLALEEGGYLDD